MNFHDGNDYSSVLSRQPMEMIREYSINHSPEPSKVMMNHQNYNLSYMPNMIPMSQPHTQHQLPVSISLSPSSSYSVHNALGHSNGSYEQSHQHKSNINTLSSQSKSIPTPGKIRYSWNTMFQALLAFGKEYGHYNVPRRYVCSLPQGSVQNDFTGMPVSIPMQKVQLGSWLTTQRMDREHGKLKEERLSLLQQLHDHKKFDWVPSNPYRDSDKKWPHMYECLVDYLETKSKELLDHGNVGSIPEKTKWKHPTTKEELGLGRWMHTQYKRKRLNKLRGERFEKLQHLVDIGIFRWPKERSNRGSNTNIVQNGLSNGNMNERMIHGINQSIVPSELSSGVSDESLPHLRNLVLPPRELINDLSGSGVNGNNNGNGNGNINSQHHQQHMSQTIRQPINGYSNENIVSYSYENIPSNPMLDHHNVHSYSHQTTGIVVNSNLYQTNGPINDHLHSGHTSYISSYPNLSNDVHDVSQFTGLTDRNHSVTIPDLNNSSSSSSSSNSSSSNSNHRSRVNMVRLNPSNYFGAGQINPHTYDSFHSSSDSIERNYGNGSHSNTGNSHNNSYHSDSEISSASEEEEEEEEEDDDTLIFTKTMNRSSMGESNQPNKKARYSYSTTDRNGSQSSNHNHGKRRI